MATGRSSSGGRSFRGKLALISAFAVLLVAAFGAGCNGFFTHAQIGSFVISPPTPTVAYPGGTTQMSAYGTNTDGTPAGNITSKVTWTSQDPGVISVGDSSMPGTTPGLLTAVNQSNSPVTITATYQALGAQTTTATVCVVGASALTISPQNYDDTTGATSQNYTASVTVNGTPGTDVSASALWSTTNSAVSIADGTTPAIATITPPTSGSAATGTITAVYTCAGNTLQATTNITVEVHP